MNRSQTRIAQPNRQDSIVLAALRSGVHVQVGKASTWEGAHALWTVLDADLGTVNGRGSNPHTIKGAPVQFYRVRQGSHEFGTVETVPVNRVARNARVVRKGK